MTDAVRLKWLLSESDARAGAAAEKLPLLSVSISWGVRRREASDTTTRAASEDLSNYKVCRAGNLVINRMRAFQGALGIAGEDGIVSPDYTVLQVAPEVDARWLNYFLTSEATVATMSSLVRGIGGTEALAKGVLSVDQPVHRRCYAPLPEPSRRVGPKGRSPARAGRGTEALAPP
jgi:type I restriction enzyme, S subunit